MITGAVNGGLAESMLKGHGLYFMPEVNGGTGAGAIQEGQPNAQGVQGEGQPNQETSLELSEHQMGFLAKNNVDVSQIGKDANVTMQAMNLLGQSRDELAQAYVKSDKALKAANKQLHALNTQPAPTTDDVLNGGQEQGVNSDKLNQLVTMANQGRAVNEALAMLGEQGKIDPSVLEVLTTQNPAEMLLKAQGMAHAGLSADQIKAMVTEGIKEGTSAIFKQFGIAADMPQQQGSDKQEQVVDPKFNSGAQAKDVQKYIDDRQKVSDEQFPMIRPGQPRF